MLNRREKMHTNSSHPNIYTYICIYLFESTDFVLIAKNSLRKHRFTSLLWFSSSFSVSLVMVLILGGCGVCYFTDVMMGWLFIRCNQSDVLELFGLQIHVSL
ncbi:hypothetical protein R6Q59_024786 [Mikania micrantha]